MNSSWKTLESTFNPAPITPLAKRIRTKGPSNSGRSVLLNTLGSKRITDSEIFVDDSDDENQTIHLPAQSAKKSHHALNSQRPLSNISNSPRKPGPEIKKEDDDDELFDNYDPDTEPNPCSNCLDPSPKRKSPLAFLTCSRTTKTISRVRKYSEDIFLEAAIDSQSPDVIEVPETDCSSQPTDDDNEINLEDLIESDDSLKSNKSAFNLDLTVIDENTNDSIVIEFPDPTIPSTIPETSSSSDGGIQANTIVECSSSNSQPLSNPRRLPINPKAKRLRAKKNGFLDQLNAAVNKAKSNFAFWHQERRMGFITNGTCFEVMEVDRTFGQCLLIVRNVEEYLMRPEDTKRIGLLLDSDLKICEKCKVGVVVEIDLSLEKGGIEVIDLEGKMVKVYPGVQYIRIV